MHVRYLIIPNASDGKSEPDSWGFTITRETALVMVCEVGRPIYFRQEAELRHELDTTLTSYPAQTLLVINKAADKNDLLPTYLERLVGDGEGWIAFVHAGGLNDTPADEDINNRLDSNTWRKFAILRRVELHFYTTFEGAQTRESHAVMGVRRTIQSALLTKQPWK